MTYDLLVPILPERKLSPNGRSHDASKAAPKRRLREFVRVWAQENGPQIARPFDHVTLDVEYRVCRSKTLPGDIYYRPTDPDNALASIKAAIDGLVDAGVLLDDKRTNVKLGDIDLVDVTDWSAEGLRFRIS